jgi:hypothetical protein
LSVGADCTRKKVAFYFGTSGSFHRNTQFHFAL